jgi:hypothetical protein
VQVAVPPLEGSLSAVATDGQHPRSMGVKHEDVTSNRARSRRGSRRAGFRRNCEPAVWPCFGAGFGAGVVHKGVPTSTHRPIPRSVIRDSDAGRPLRWGGRLAIVMPADLSGGEAGWSFFNVFAKYWDEVTECVGQCPKGSTTIRGRLGAHSPVVADRARRRAGELALARLSSGLRGPE